MSGRTALYARVSSETQAKEGTIESQVEAVRQYIAERGWSLDPDDEYVDNGISGTRLERPALERLRDAIACGVVGRVVVLSRDRLSRNFVHQEYLAEEWHKAGCQLVYVQEPSIATAEDLFASRVRGILAEHERLVFQERTRRGQLQRARRGEPPPSAPWGYRYIAGKGAASARWEVVAEPAEWVRRIFRWVWQEHWPVRHIARRLNECAVLPPQGGSHWRSSSVHRLLRNPAYQGETYYRRSLRKHTRGDRGPWKQDRPLEEWIRIPVPALLSREEWQMTQEELARRTQLARRHATPRRYLLQGLLRCGRGGRRLAGRKEGLWLYYACRGKREERASVRCPSAYVRADALESLLWQAVRELVLSPEQVCASYAEQQAAWQTGECQQEHQALQRDAQTITQRWQRMLSAYECQSISLDELKQARQRKEQAEQAWQRRHQVWQHNCQKWANLDDALSELGKYREALQVNVDKLTFEQRREILTLLVEEAVVYDDKVVVRHILPEHPALCPPHRRGLGVGQ